MIKIKYRKNDKYAVIPFIIPAEDKHNHNIITECVNEAITKHCKTIMKSDNEITADIVEISIDLENNTGYACVAFV